MAKTVMAPIVVAGGVGVIVVAGVFAALLIGRADPADMDEAAIIAEATSGKLTATAGKVFEASCNEDLDYEATVIDLNGDGQPEVFTQLHGICLGGRTGVSLNLYVRDEGGEWHPQFGFPGIYRVLESENLGYPDIEIGGPGSCFPVWRWNGKRYDLHTSCPL